MDTSQTVPQVLMPANHITVVLQLESQVVGKPIPTEILVAQRLERQGVRYQVVLI